MAQVYEISRTAFEQLPKHDHANGYGDYVVVGMHATFGRAGRVLHVVENFDSEYWACRRCDGMNANSLFSGLVAADCIYEYEVWHIVDDEPGYELIALEFDAEGGLWENGAYDLANRQDADALVHALFKHSTNTRVCELYKGIKRVKVYIKA